MNYTIKPFDKTNDGHYEALVALEAAVYPNYPTSIASLKGRDAQRAADRYKYRAIVVDGLQDDIVAVGDVHHTVDTYHPQKFVLDMFIDPARDAPPLRETFHTYLTDHAAQFDPIQLSVSCNSSQQHIIDFYEKQGYVMKVREYSSKLELATFDPTPFQKYVDRVSANGIEIFDIQQLKARYPDKWVQLVYDVVMAVDQDVPWHEPIQRQPYESWVKRFCNQPDRLNQCYLIAMDGDRPVGVTMVFKMGAVADKLFTGLSGVVRSHRRRGITAALKVRSLSTAKMMFENASIMTENEENNPMYTMNERFGFVRQPDYLNWVKKLG